MLIMTILPVCIYAKRRFSVRIIKGGTDVRHAPTINYIYHVLLPTLKKMGLETSVDIDVYGYYPVYGGGPPSCETKW